MTQNQSTHDMKMVSNNHWQTFFSDLAQNYQGQPVSIEIGQDLLVNNQPKAKVPLRGIDYDKHKGVVISTGSGAEAETYTVEAPDLVWAVHDEHGNLVAVEVIARDERNLILRLKP